MKSSELYRLFFEEASDALLAVSLVDGQVLAVNQGLVALSGFNREELEGESLNVLNSAAYEGRERHLDLDVMRAPGFYNDIALSTRDGSVRYVSVKVRHVQIEKQSLALAVLSDDTERQLLIRDLATKHQSLEQAYLELERVHRELKTAQERMMQVSKLVALGELAAGMSHELNQPLTGIRGFAQEVLDMLKHDAKPSKAAVRGLCSEIVLNADKMAKLLSDLRNYARREKREQGVNEDSTLVDVPVSQVFESVQNLMRKSFRDSGVELLIDQAPDGALVRGQAQGIEQILINLLSNARDAVLERGPSHRPRVALEVETSATRTFFRVRDNGPGVREALRAKIFDPFFSTKDPGKGMGLGLSISFGLAHRFGGELRLEKSSSDGSTFVLELESTCNHGRKAA